MAGKIEQAIDYIAQLEAGAKVSVRSLAQALGVTPNKTEVTIYTDKMHDDITWGNIIKAYVDTAIAEDEFRVYLQPKFDINREVIEGAEALIRWDYKGKGLLSPGRFVPFFERDGSIGKIDDIVLEKGLMTKEALDKALDPVAMLHAHKL